MSRKLFTAIAGSSLLACIGAAGPHRAAASSPAPFHLIKRIPMPGLGGWDYLSTDADARRIYVTRGSHVTVVNADTGRIIADVPGFQGVHGVAIDQRDSKLFVSDGRANQAVVLSSRTLAKLGSAATGEGPDAILYDPSTRRVFTFNGRGQSATAIDARTGTVVGTVPLPGRPEFAVADGHGLIYDNLEDKSEVAVLDAKTLTVKAIWPLTDGEGPSGIALDEPAHRLYSVCGNGKMTVLDTRTGKSVAALPIGQGPDAAECDTQRGLVFSSNGEDGTMSIYKKEAGDRYQQVQVLATQAGARTMTLDRKTHHVFVMAGTRLPVQPGQEAQPWRRQYAPGSFVLLEYGQ